MLTLYHFVHFLTTGNLSNLKHENSKFREIQVMMKIINLKTHPKWKGFIYLAIKITNNNSEPKQNA